MFLLTYTDRNGKRQEVEYTSRETAFRHGTLMSRLGETEAFSIVKHTIDKETLVSNTQSVQSREEKK